MSTINKFVQSIKQFSKRIRKSDFTLWGALFGSSLVIVLVQLIYLNLRYAYLVEEIPLFYTRNWGADQIVSKEAIFIIPAFSIVISILGLLFFYYLSVKFFQYGTRLIFFVVNFANLFLTFSLFRVIKIGLAVTTPLIPENYVPLILPFFLSLGLGLFFSPWYVRLMSGLGIVTDPKKHDHPAMILKKPSARGGGLLFTLILSALSVIFVPLSLEVTGILVAALLIAIVGILDDYQNTHADSSLKFLENPLLRLGILLFIVSTLYFFNIKIDFFTNLFGRLFFLNQLNFSVGGIFIQPVAWLFTTLWIVWILNLLSWSNGVDGQYSGIVGIASVFLALLALRFEVLTPEQLGYSRVAAISAGAALGLVAVTWFPSRIMWGFGAMSAGLVIAALSTLIQAKVITSLLILLVPFLDAAVTLVRRIWQGKNPLKGDRGHLHHLLMDRGFSVPQIALFYWLVTLLFGGLSLFSTDKPFVQTILMGLGVLLFVIVLTNLQLAKGRKAQPELGTKLPTEEAPETAASSESLQ